MLSQLLGREGETGETLEVHGRGHLAKAAVSKETLSQRDLSQRDPISKKVKGMDKPTPNVGDSSPHVPGGTHVAVYTHTHIHK